MHEMSCQILDSSHSGKKIVKARLEHGERRDKVERERVEKQAKPSGVINSLRLQLTTDVRINLTKVKSGQPYIVGRHQARLKPPNYTLEGLYPLQVR